MPDSLVLIPGLRPARRTDARGIADLVRRAYARWAPVVGHAEPGPRRADYVRAIADHPIWVVEEDGRLVAVLELLPAADHLMVENVAVRPDRQGQGIGHALMRFAESEARREGTAEVRLFTDERFTEDVSFYDRLGYAPFERVPQGDATLVFMAKRVDGGGPAAGHPSLPPLPSGHPVR